MLEIPAPKKVDTHWGIPEASEFTRLALLASYGVMAARDTDSTEKAEGSRTTPHVNSGPPYIRK